MDYIMRLSALSPREICVVKSIESGPDIRRRLQDMGLIPGTRVECLFKSPSGDPTAYCVRGAVLALRQEDADNIFVIRKSGEC